MKIDLMVEDFMKWAAREDAAGEAGDYDTAADCCAMKWNVRKAAAAGGVETEFETALNVARGTKK